MREIIQSNQAGGLVINQPQAIDRNPAAVYLATLSESGRRTQRQALDTIARMLAGESANALTLEWAEVRYQHAAAIRVRLAESYKAATVNKMLAGLRGVLRHAYRLGLISADDYQKAAAVESVKGETIPAGRGLTPGELQALLVNCENDPTPAGPRDAAIIAVMYAGGPRRGELPRLDLASYDPESGRLVILGKRNKERTAYLNNGAAAALSDWLAIRGSDSGPLFLAINKGGKIIPGRITDQAIYGILRKRAILAGVRPFSPHDLRRTFISDLLDAGADIATVAKMAGHASVNTTARYDRRPEQAKQKAAGLLHVPYRRRS